MTINDDDLPELTADDMRKIVDFEKRFISALHSLAKHSDYDASGNLTPPAFERLWREAWVRARPEHFEHVMRLERAMSIIDRALAKGVLEYADAEHHSLVAEELSHPC